MVGSMTPTDGGREMDFKNSQSQNVPEATYTNIPRAIQM
jgi:hypothetical protein